MSVEFGKAQDGPGRSAIREIPILTAEREKAALAVALEGEKAARASLETDLPKRSSRAPQR